MRGLHMRLVAVWCVAQMVVAQYLLPGDMTPRHYHLKYTFDIDPKTNFSYYGVAEISLYVKQATNGTVLHAKDFTVREDMILIRGPKELKTTGAKVNDTNNMLTISMSGSMRAGETYTVIIPFYGNLKPEMDGAYISTYVNKQTKAKEYLIATQFEAISARKGFPCFDEPMYKATFTITIGHHKDFTAISNMPQERSTGINALEEYFPWSVIERTFMKKQTDFVWDTYEKSVPMSTYLVAFGVSKFSYRESPHDLSTTKFRIWARNDALDQTTYASITGPKVLSYFEEWFNVSFPLPKQDMIAIPDFAFGAMENWGLITYRETDLLYDDKQSSLLDKERVADTIAHELAHQWFGNLVTMKWWSDVWLNEGFATFAASVAVNKVEPTWHADRNYAVNHMLVVLTLDALESSHSVSVPIFDDPKRIWENFDPISYKKGSTLIRMMTMFLGDDVFRRAIKNYLVKYSYNNAEQDDLWRELTAVSQEYAVLTRNVTVKEIMDTWTTQTGYPVLTVTRDYSDKSLIISQKRYFSLMAKRATSASWWVPLSVLCEPDGGASPAPRQWLPAHDGVSQEYRFEHSSEPNQWILFNHDMIALYRVNYDKRNWKLLSEALRGARFSDIPLMGRVQLMSDVFALAWTNHLDYSTALGIASYLQQERNFLPLSTALKALAKIENVLKRTPDYGAFQKFVRKVIGETYERAGGLAQKKIINAQDTSSVKMQVTTSSWACRMNVPGCEENAMQLFQQWMDTPNPDQNNPIPLDLRRTVYCVGVSRGSVLQWRFVLAREQRTNVAVAREALLRALSCTKEVWILSQYLEWTVSEDLEVRKQDAAAVIGHIIRSTVGYYVAKDFIYERIADLYNTFKGHGRRDGSFIKALLEQFTTQRELDEFLVWREKNQQYLQDFKLSVEQAIEKATVNIDWVTKNRKIVVEKLREFTAGGEPEAFERDTLYSKMSNNHASHVTLPNNKLYSFFLFIFYIIIIL